MPFCWTDPSPCIKCLTAPFHYRIRLDNYAIVCQICTTVTSISTVFDSHQFRRHTGSPLLAHFVRTFRGPGLGLHLEIALQFVWLFPSSLSLSLLFTMRFRFDGHVKLYIWHWHVTPLHRDYSSMTPSMTLLHNFEWFSMSSAIKWSLDPRLATPGSASGMPWRPCSWRGWHHRGCAITITIAIAITYILPARPASDRLSRLGRGPRSHCNVLTGTSCVPNRSEQRVLLIDVMAPVGICLLVFALCRL